MRQLITDSLTIKSPERDVQKLNLKIANRLAGSNRRQFISYCGEEGPSTARCGSGDMYVINGAINCRHAYQGLRSCKIYPEHSTWLVTVMSAPSNEQGTVFIKYHDL
jgi:hypothetical protein